MQEFKTLQDLVADTKVNKDTYVYYDQETGKIKRVGGKTESNGLSYITTDPKLVEPIMKGLKGLDDYVVEYDISKKTLNLKEVKRPEAEDEKSLLTFKEVPTLLKTKKVDVLIQQNLKKQVWIIRLSKSIVDSLKSESVYIRSNLFFSVTEKGNPNVLYRTISCPISELVNEENYTGKEFSFKYDIENSTNLSVFTSKYFDAYKYEVIK